MLSSKDFCYNSIQNAHNKCFDVENLKKCKTADIKNCISSLNTCDKLLSAIIKFGYYSSDNDKNSNIYKILHHLELNISSDNDKKAYLIKLIINEQIKINSLHKSSIYKKRLVNNKI